MSEGTSCAPTPSDGYSWPSMEVSPSPVYGARLLSGLRASTLSRVQIPPPPPCDVSGHRNSLNPRFVGSGFFVLGLGLVVAGGVDGEFAEDFAGDGVDDGDVEVVGEDEDAGSCVGSSDADVVEFAVDS